MATITLIQGTDSLSASRVTLNDNFTALNDELGLVTGLLDPTTSTLSNMTGVSTDALDVTGAASFASTGNVLSADTAVDGLLQINGGATYDAETVAVMPAANAFESSSYIVTVASANIEDAEEGQEITVIADAGVTVNVTATSGVAGVNTITLNPGATVTLRFHGNIWYLIAASPAPFAIIA